MRARDALGVASLLLAGGCALVVHFGDYTDGSGGAGGSGGQATSSTSASSSASSSSSGAPCTNVSQCPGADTDCQYRVCDGGFCGVAFHPQNKPVSAQKPGDCQTLVCDGAGGTLSIADDSDLPPDDLNECTKDECVSGTVSYTPLLNAPCGPNGTLKCGKEGLCAGCTTPADCGADGECFSWSCDPGNGTKICNKNESAGPCGAGPTCTAGNAKPADQCMSGICQPAASVPCSPYACSGGACTSPCTGSSDCVSGYGCVGGACVPAAPNGAACTANSGCASGYCVGNICCDAPCAGSCTNATTYQPQSCGTGTCTAGTPQDCKQYACGTAGCATSCSSDADCAVPNYTCANAACCAKCQAWAGGKATRAAVCPNSVPSMKMAALLSCICPISGCNGECSTVCQSPNAAMDSVCASCAASKCASLYTDCKAN